MGLDNNILNTVIKDLIYDRKMIMQEQEKLKEEIAILRGENERLRDLKGRYYQTARRTIRANPYMKIINVQPNIKTRNNLNR